MEKPADQGSGKLLGYRDVTGVGEDPAATDLATLGVAEMGLTSDAADRAQKRVGKVIKGKYALNRVIGVGGMAAVYAATHRNKKRFAVKMLHPEVALDQDVTQRFTREGYVANTVGHPGTVEVFDDDVTDDGAPFLVMELLQGETLEARWERKDEQLPPTEVLPVVDQLLDVLIAAHGKGIVHRDLKPENLFLTRDGRLKVLDFGIARLREVSKASQAATRAGSLLGTPAFMAPEQSRGRWDEVDGQTDIWAVGAVIFTMLSGRYVHEADTVNEQLIMAATVPAPSIAKFIPELPPALVELVDRALAFNKINRWPDALAMQKATQAVIADFQGSSAPLALPKPSVAVNVDQETILAPSESNPASSALLTPQPGDTPQKPKSETLTTARAITSNAPVSARRDPQGRRRAWIGAAIAVLTLAIVGTVTILRSGSASPTSTAASPGELPTSPTDPIVDPPKPEGKTATKPIDVEPDLRGDAGAPEPAAKKPPSVGKPTAVTKPTAVAKPPVSKSLVPTKPPTQATPVTKPTSPPKTNPFDRRH